MPHLLAQYCRLSRTALRDAREVLVGCEKDAAFPPELRERFSSLYLRSRRPEVRVLVSGPLKAGKSTLLNVLAKNPHVSQISQLPAYPCFVEVRDLERSSNGEPEEEERSLFYRSDGSLGEELSHQEGIRLLDRLLEDYLQAGPEAQVEYRRVVQKVDLPSEESGVELTLIDAPGLFFDRRIDFESFPGEIPGKLGNSDSFARRYYRQADVVIFVVRPEQLYFQSVNDYLGELVRQTKMRLFLLVNASRRSKTQEGERIVDFDQVEQQDGIRRSFLKRFGDRSLLEGLEEGGRISLHFTDLLEAAVALLTPEGDAQGFSHSRSGEAIESIRRYLFGGELARLKIEDLSLTIGQTLVDGREALSHVHRSIEVCLDELRSSAAEAEAERSRAKSELNELSSQREDSESLMGRLRTRLETTRLYLENHEAPESSSDPVLQEFLDLLKPSELSQQLSQSLDDLARREVREVIDEIYHKWRAGDYGVRTLKSLAEALWEAKLEGDRLSLRAYSQQAVRDCFREVLSHASQSAQSAQLREALQRIDPSKLEVTSSNPVLAMRTLPLLEFPSPWSLRLRAWKTGFRLTPWVIWGEDRNKPIADPFEERVLFQQRKILLRQVWGRPWSLGECFEPGHLQSAARRLLLAKICRLWGVRINEDIRMAEQDLNAADSQLEQARRLFERLEQESLDRRARIEEGTAASEDLLQRQDRLAEIEDQLQRASLELEKAFSETPPPAQESLEPIPLRLEPYSPEEDDPVPGSEVVEASSEASLRDGPG